MKDEPTDDVELLHSLFAGPTQWSKPDQVNGRPDPGVELRFDVPDGDGKVYVQCKPFAVQAYDEDDTREANLLDATWDELRKLNGDDPAWKLELEDMQEFVEERRVEE